MPLPSQILHAMFVCFFFPFPPTQPPTPPTVMFFWLCCYRYHSLHHSRVHTNFSLFMPIYDYLGGTVDATSDELHSFVRKSEDPIHLHDETWEFLRHSDIMCSVLVLEEILIPIVK
jgi:sterol desaturase/sphingolipid hydroxylase (fatty acid hydroxylase superfamily)